MWPERLPLVQEDNVVVDVCVCKGEGLQRHMRHQVIAQAFGSMPLLSSSRLFPHSALAGNTVCLHNSSTDEIWGLWVMPQGKERGRAEQSTEADA